MGWRRGWITLVVAVAVPVAVAVAWIPVRSGQPAVVVALALVMVITAAGASRRRAAVVAAAVSAALAFTYFDTEPYDRFRIARLPDLETVVALLVVGMLTGELALRVARQRRTDRGAAGDLGRVREASARLALGEELVTMIGAVAGQIRDLLGATDCAFSAEPLPAGTPVVARDGSVEGPAGGRLGLPVWGLGAVVGYFVAPVGSGAPPPREALAVAMTLADQVGAALAAQTGSLPPGPAGPALGPALRVVR